MPPDPVTTPGAEARDSPAEESRHEAALDPRPSTPPHPSRTPRPT
ncbi:hypothetical protein [Streptomyces sp. BBFR102]